MEFYSGVPHYYDCSFESDKSRFIEPIADIARGIHERNGHVRILELGAGRSQAPEVFRKRLEGVSYSFELQDINDRNASFYDACGLKLHVGAVEDIPAGPAYDLIFGMFVYEHLCRPARSLDAVRGRLRSRGVIVLIAPEYVLPFYVPPALRHLSGTRRMREAIRLFASNVRTRLTGRPNFWVYSEPAVFHGPWRRDADAVHMVSKADIVAYLGDEFDVGDLAIEIPRGLRAFVASKCLLRVVARKKT